MISIFCFVSCDDKPKTNEADDKMLSTIQKGIEDQLRSNDSVKKRSGNFKRLRDSVYNATGCWNDTLSLSEVEFNGHDIFISPEKFKKLEIIDSSKNCEWGCGSPFDWLDSTKKYKEITTFFCGNIEYISNQHKVLLSALNVKGNKFNLKIRNKILDEKTTLEEFSKIFPVAYLLDKDGTPDKEKGKRFDIAFKCKFDDHWLFYFKDNKLFRIELWWELC